MKIYKGLNEITIKNSTAVALGNFDGVHRGHAELISRTVDYAKKNGIDSAVFTFSNPPRNFIAHRTVVKNIITNSDKAHLIEKLGIDHLVSVPFDADFHAMDPEFFIKDIVLGKMHAKSISCGFNFHFGKNASGGVELLGKEASRDGFDLEVLEPVIVDGVIVSSTKVREAIATGDMERAKDYLGRRFSLEGIVEHGDENGRKMGFPTANFAPAKNMIIPAFGVYASYTKIDDGKPIRSVTNVGIRPTVGGEKLLIEPHLIDFNEEIYDRKIRVEFVSMLRGEKRFSGMDELASQISKDRKSAIDILKP